MAKIRISTLAFFLIVGITVFSLQYHAYAVPCDAIVGKWAWFTDGVVTINPDGTMIWEHGEHGNDGTWECTDPSRGMFTLRWRLGGFVNSLALSGDGQGLSSTDQSQWYVTAKRVGAGADVKADATAHFNKGVDHYNKKMYDEAIAEFTEAIKINPSYADAYYNRSLVYHDLEAYEKSLSDLNKAIELNPNYAKAYDMRADIHDHLGDYENALKDLEKAQGLGYEVDPEFLDELREATGRDVVNQETADTYFSGGFDFYNKEMYDEAIAEYTKAIEINPEYADAYNNRGAAHKGKGQNDQAISDYTKAIEINPKYARAYSNRCVVYKDKKLYDQAISDCTRAIELDPRYADAYSNRGAAYIEEGRYDNAIPDLTKAIELNPEYVTAYNNRCGAYNGKKLYDQAISDCTRAIEINPKYANAYYNRGVTYYNKGEYDKAREDVHKAQELGFQVDPKFLDDLGKAAQESKQPAQEVTPEDLEEMAQLVERISRNYYMGTPEFHSGDDFFDDDYIRKEHSVTLREDFTLVERYLECTITSPEWRFGDDNRIPADYNMSADSVEDCDKNSYGLKWEEETVRIPLAQIEPSSFKLSETDTLGDDNGSNFGISFDYGSDPFAISNIRCKDRSACEQMAADLKKLVEIAAKYAPKTP